MSGQRRMVRAYFFPLVAFDLAVPEEAGDADIQALIRQHARDAPDWFDSLPKPTMLGDGNMTLEFDARNDGVDWEDDTEQVEDES